MSWWSDAALVFMVALLATGWACCRGATVDRLVGLMLAGELATLVLLALAAAYHRAFYIDCAVAAAILPYPSSIVFAHFFEKWL